MIKTKEWGEFIPAELSTFPYKDSVASEYYPTTKEKEEKHDYKPQTATIPDDINDVQQSITDEILACKTCKKNFKIQNQELKFYKEFQLALPENCWLCRHRERMAMRNPRVIHDRTCGKCQAQIKSTYAPSRPEIIYCEKCYLKEVA